MTGSMSINNKWVIFSHLRQRPYETQRASATVVVFVSSMMRSKTTEKERPTMVGDDVVPRSERRGPTARGDTSELASGRAVWMPCTDHGANLGELEASIGRQSRGSHAQTTHAATPPPTLLHSPNKRGVDVSAASCGPKKVFIVLPLPRGT